MNRSDVSWDGFFIFSLRHLLEAGLVVKGLAVRALRRHIAPLFRLFG